MKKIGLFAFILLISISLTSCKKKFNSEKAKFSDFEFGNVYIGQKIDENDYYRQMDENLAREALGMSPKTIVKKYIDWAYMPVTHNYDCLFNQFLVCCNCKYYDSSNNEKTITVYFEKSQLHSGGQDALSETSLSNEQMKGTFEVVYFSFYYEGNTYKFENPNL